MIGCQSYLLWPPLLLDLYLKLEDVTRRFSRPCIMDVKVGRRSYDPLALLEKREQQIAKYPLMEEIGFLLLGMRVRERERKNLSVCVCVCVCVCV